MLSALIVSASAFAQAQPIVRQPVSVASASRSLVVAPSKIKPTFEKYVSALGPLAQSPPMLTCVASARQGNTQAVGAVLVIARGLTISQILESRSGVRRAAAEGRRILPGGAAAQASSPSALTAMRKMAAGLKYCDGLHKSAAGPLKNGSQSR